MTNTDSSQHSDSGRKTQTALLSTIAGAAAGKYIVLANWNYQPMDPGEVTCCIVEVESMPARLEWRTLHSIETWGTAIARLTPSSFLVGNQDGDIIKIDNNILKTFNAELPGGIGAIAATSATECWLTHTGGLSHWDGKKIRTIKLDVGDLYGIHFLHLNFAVTVGDGGAVFRFDGTVWNRVDSSPTNRQLLRVFCVSRDEIYICGWNGTLFRWDGQDNWKKIDVMDDGHILGDHIYSVIGYKGEIYLCIGKQGLFKITGKTATRIQDFYCSRAAVIDDKLILTGMTSFVEFDGANWRHTIINLP